MFTYRPLDASRQEIRLLRPSPSTFSLHPAETANTALSFEIVHASLLQQPLLPYETISYCWGDPTPRESLRINGQLLLVPSNTYHALRRIATQFSTSQPATLWVDAVCIHQADNEERARQVALMGTVFSMSKGNLVYLGEDDVSTATAMAIVNLNAIIKEVRETTGDSGKRQTDVENMRTYFSAVRKGVIPPMRTKLDVEALVAFFGRPWFRRLWVVQEVILAPQNFCFCGTHKLKLIEILDAAAWLRCHWQSIPLDLASNDGVDAASAMWDIAMRKLLYDHLPGALALMMIQSNALEVSDSRDRVFGMLGLLHPQYRSSMFIRPDYGKSAQAVLRDAIWFCINYEGQHVIFRYLQHRSEFELSVEGSPSWVPRIWRRSDVCYDVALLPHYRTNHSKFQPSPDLVAPYLKDPRILQLRGVILDRIARISSALFPENGRLESEKPKETLAQVYSVMMETQTQTPQNAVARTLTVDVNHLGGRSSERDQNGVSALIEQIFQQGPIHYFRNIPSNADERTVHASQYFSAMVSACRHRKFFLTESNHVGLAPQLAQVGDLVVMMKYGQRPLALRPVDDEYQMLGECYLHGFMYDEEVARFEAEGGEEVVFRIR